MSLIAWIIVGALAGWLASLIMGTDKDMGIIANIIVGMIGSIIGGFLVALFTRGDADFTTAFTDFSISSVLVSLLGAIVLLGIMRMFRRKPVV